MRFERTEYEADQDLISASKETGASGEKDDEWLNLTCANRVRGWLLLRDLHGSSFGGPNIIEYGVAQDR